MHKNWIDASVEKPPRSRWYDLFKLDVGDKVIHGWWNGTSWEGLRYNGEHVKRWKSMYE